MTRLLRSCPRGGESLERAGPSSSTWTKLRDLRRAASWWKKDRIPVHGVFHGGHRMTAVCDETRRCTDLFPFSSGFGEEGGQRGDRRGGGGGRFFWSQPVIFDIGG